MDYKLMITVAFLVISEISAATLYLGKDDKIVKQINNPYQDGTYKFGYETQFGLRREEIGVLKKNSLGNQYLVTTGFYSYRGPNDKIYKVRYIADDKGYRILPNTSDQEDVVVFEGETVTTTKPPAISKIFVNPDEEDDEGIGNRVGLPADIVGSLIGG